MLKTAIATALTATAVFLGCGVAQASTAIDRIGGIAYWGEVYCNPEDVFDYGLDLPTRKLLVDQVVWDSVFRAATDRNFSRIVAEAQAGLKELNDYCAAHYPA